MKTVEPKQAALNLIVRDCRPWLKTWQRAAGGCSSTPRRPGPLLIRPNTKATEGTPSDRGAGKERPLSAGMGSTYKEVICKRSGY